MKKFIAILCVIGIMVALLPIKAKAAIFVEDGGSYKNDSPISMGKYGTIATGDMSWTYTDEDNGIKEWKIYLTPSSNVNTIYFELVPTGLAIQTVVPNSSALVKESQNATSAGVELIFRSTNVAGLVANQKVLLATITTKDTSETGCLLNLSPLNLSCKQVGNDYYDENGTKVSKEAFDQSCGNVTPVVPDKDQDIESPDTGNVVPYLAIAGGLGAVILVYLYSRRQNKMFKL